MTEQRHDKPRQSHHGFFSFVVLTGLKIILASVLAWLFLVCWFIGQTFYRGQESAITAAQTIATQHLQFIQSNTTYLADGLLPYLTKAQSGVADLLAWIIHWNSKFLQSAADLFLAITEIQLLRFLIFILALPLFILVLLIFIIDGLVKRDIRKFQGARESALVFHRLKGFTGFCFFAPFFIYLSIPIAINPLFIFIPQMLLWGSTMALSLTYFKKYL